MAGAAMLAPAVAQEDSAVIVSPYASLGDISGEGPIGAALETPAPTQPQYDGSTEPGGIVFDPSLIEAGCWRCTPCVPGADPAGKGFPTVAITGFFQADALYFHQDTLNTAIVTDAQDVADFRRARLAAKGKVADNVDYFMEYDFAFPGRPSFMDVYADFADLAPVGRLRVGQWRQPFGMDAQTSVKELMFLERALPFALVPFRQIGIGLYDTAMDQQMTWAVSGYRFPTDVFGNANGDSGYGFTTRETVLLYDGGCDRTLHAGAAYTYNRPSNAATRLRSTPEVGFTQLDFTTTNFPVPFFVDTNAIATDSYQIYNLELAGTRGPLFFQSEYYGANLDPVAGGGLDFNGAYAQVAYCLTGESHAYNKAAGVYGRIIPHRNYGHCGVGAWEIAARWSYLDLTDGAVTGGEITDYTLGLNWYLNRYTKFQFNYIHVDLERPAAVDSDANVFAARAQLDF